MKMVFATLELTFAALPNTLTDGFVPAARASADVRVIIILSPTVTSGVKFAFARSYRHT